MSWNYRVVKREHEVKVGDHSWTETRYQIHEVYYNEKGKPTGCTVDPITLAEEDIDDLRDSVLRILKSIDEKPVLDYDKDFFSGQDK